MRVIAQLVTMISLSVAVSAQQTRPAAPSGQSSPAQDEVTGQETAKEGTLALPVSLDKIREALAQPPPPADLLKGLNEQPTFRLEVRERQRFEELMKNIKFESGGPVVAGGRDNYDQLQRNFPRIDNPRVQPYGAFSTGEILTLGVEAFVAKYVAQKVGHVFSDVLRTQEEREAREEVARSLAAFWAAQPSAPPPEPKP
jgi:hypothetical protein